MGNAILAVGLNPVMQKTILLRQLWENEVNRSDRYYFTVAGKGANTARVLTELGAEVLHLTHAGGNYEHMFRSMLREDQVPLFAADSGSEIRLCYTLINEEKHTVTEIVEEAKPVLSDTDRQVRRLYQQLLEQAQLITISGTKAAGYSDDIIPWMVRLACEAGKRVILDIKGRDLLESIPFKPYIIKPNMKEFSETLFPDQLFREHETEKDIRREVEKKMIELYEELGTITVLTRGARSVLYCSDGSIAERTVTPVKPLNSIGSGDSFTAGLTFGVSRGLSMAESIDIAVSCGKKNAQLIKPGTITG